MNMELEYWNSRRRRPRKIHRLRHLRLQQSKLTKESMKKKVFLMRKKMQRSSTFRTRKIVWGRRKEEHRSYLTSSSKSRLILRAMALSIPSRISMIWSLKRGWLSGSIWDQEEPEADRAVERKGKAKMLLLSMEMTRATVTTKTY